VLEIGRDARPSRNNGRSLAERILRTAAWPDNSAQPHQFYHGDPIATLF
jgi:hypothetical protein